MSRQIVPPLNQNGLVEKNTTSVAFSDVSVGVRQRNLSRQLQTFWKGG